MLNSFHERTVTVFSGSSIILVGRINDFLNNLNTYVDQGMDINTFYLFDDASGHRLHLCLDSAHHIKDVSWFLDIDDNNRETFVNAIEFESICNNMQSSRYAVIYNFFCESPWDRCHSVAAIKAISAADWGLLGEITRSMSTDIHSYIAKLLEHSLLPE
ncbi:MAG: hypothetical protein KA743_00545 [Geothrix sp.]|jgi:hypothetical protein|nr:hypothetical protein [Geothrix sp.]